MFQAGAIVASPLGASATHARTCTCPWPFVVLRCVGARCTIRRRADRSRTGRDCKLQQLVVRQSAHPIELLERNAVQDCSNGRDKMSIDRAQFVLVRESVCHVVHPGREYDRIALCVGTPVFPCGDDAGSFDPGLVDCDEFAEFLGRGGFAPGINCRALRGCVRTLFVHVGFLSSSTSDPASPSRTRGRTVPARTGSR